jgi:predicted ester cyclase
MKALSSIIRAANRTLLANGKHDAIGAFFATDYVVHLAERDVAGGHALVRDYLELVQRAFPKLKVEVEILVQGTDRVAWQRTLRAKQQGAFKGFPSEGKTIVWRDAITSRIRDGLIAEEWVVSDLAEQLLLSRKRSSAV